MNTEHGNEDVRTFSKSANSDKEKEFLGSQNTGEYIGSRNARNYSLDGNTESLEKIKGEEVVYTNTGLSANYVCIGTAKVRDNIVEFWASNVVGELDSIRINGTVVAANDNLLFEVDRPLQLDTNDKCEGGEVFITDDFTVPMIFNVQDLLDNALTQKYFTEFNRALYEINLSTPVDKPVFSRLVTVGGGGGLPIGEYSYAVRYVNSEGDRTNLSPSTPLIPVVQSLGVASDQYPYTKTRGGESNTSVVTAYGIELRIRVTNLVEYDSLEVVRFAWNSGTQLGYTPDPQIVARLDVSNTRIGIITFTDPLESNIQESIPEDELTNQLLFIERAKAIRYFDKRLVLMNYSVADRDLSPSFIRRNGNDGRGPVEMFPVMEKLGKVGFNDPKNHTYKKSYQCGESYGFAINAYDGVSAKAFAIPIENFKDYTFPNRRDELVAASDSDIYSTGAVTAANTSGGITKTFEVFDHEDAVGKSDVNSFKSILDGTNFLGLPEGTKSNGDVTQFTTSDPEDYGANVNALGRVTAPYAVYTPKEDSDPVSNSHNYRINPSVKSGSTDIPYNPAIFGLNYYSRGIMLNGVSNLPSWVKSFSVVRTKRANRVLCQGLGMYKMNEGKPKLVGNAALATKDRNKIWFYSPDIENGIVSDSIIQDMQNNPNNYKLQFVSPLGFCSELYNFDNSISARDRNCDLITYARILNDGPLVGKNINPLESASMGNLGNVAYNRYRNDSDTVNDDFFDNAAGGGNRLTTLTGFEVVTEGRGVYYELEVQDLIYNRANTGGTGNNNFLDQGMKDWTEPFYIVNIIQEGASIVDQNIDSYKDTGAYVKMESIIGEGVTGNLNPSFELVDERWEDCIPDLSSTGPFAAEERFVYIRDAAGNDLPWYNVTYLTAGQISTIVNNILANGSHTLPSTTVIYGVYTHTVNSPYDIRLNFNIPGFNNILTNTTVIVKYDNRAPIRVFGGDTTVGESIFAPIDREVDVNNWDKFTGAVAFSTDLTAKNPKGFPLDLGFPFKEYHVNPRHYILKNPSLAVDKVQASRNAALNPVYGNLYYIRQLCVMFTVESRMATHFSFSGIYPDQTFPNVHYVMRPNSFSESKFGTTAKEVYEDNSIHPNYEEDYGDEYLNWNYGGFRFKPKMNVDYSQEIIDDFVSKPDFGYEAETDFCTGVIWSLPRSINQQDSPGLKSFASLNTIQLEDAQGEINLAFDATTGKGSNVYAITDRGICMLLHKKSILSDTTGAEIGLFKGSNFIQQEYWLDRNIGCPGFFWRGAAEGSVGIRQLTSSGAEGEVQRIEALVFPNGTSIYRFVENTIKDIGRDSYFKEVNGFVKGIPNSTAEILTAYYDEVYNEYVIQSKYADPTNPAQTILLEQALVYSFNNSGWISKYDYRFDKYLSFKDRVYGMRDGETYKLQEGFLINGSPVIFEAETVSSMAPQKEKEFLKINVNSNKIPTRVEFKDGNDQILCALDQSIQGPLYLKKYDGYTQQIPRKDLTVSPGRNRVQDRLLVYKIIHNLGEDFVLKDSVVTFKLIK